MLSKHFNRHFIDIGIYGGGLTGGVPCFVSEQLTYFGKDMEEYGWIDQNYGEYFRSGEYKNGAKQSVEQVKRIVSHGGLILEIAAGPGGGYAPHILSENYEASVMISDICPSVPRGWKKLFSSLENPPPNVEYAAIDGRELPFENNCLDVICGRPLLAEIHTNKMKALREMHRVLKPGGLLVLNDICYDKECFYKMKESSQKTLLKQNPECLTDYTDELKELNFSNVEVIECGTFAVDEDSDTGWLMKILGEPIIMRGIMKYCYK